MANYILRVDDIGWTPDMEPDRNLEYFQQWRAALHKSSGVLPAVYGVIVGELSDRELQWLAEYITPPEYVAVHGYKHERMATRSIMQLAYDIMPTQFYIPPYNEYRFPVDVGNWAIVSHQHMMPVFLGGWQRPQSMIVNGCLYIPCNRDLYGADDPKNSEHDIAAIIAGGYSPPEITYPVVTIHHRWCQGNFHGTEKLGEVLAGRLLDPGNINIY